MRKWIPIALAGSLMLGGAAYAHIEGAFKDFLAGAQNENSAEKLKAEIADTKKQIKELTPNLEEATKEYETKADGAAKTLMFYSAASLDVFAGFVAGADNVTDALASAKMVEGKIKKDIDSLGELYEVHERLKAEKASYEGHQALLEAIEGNLAGRKEMFSVHGSPKLTPEENAQRVSMAVAQLWQSEAYGADQVLMMDSAAMNQGAKTLFERKSPSSPFRLDEKKLNEKTHFRYYIRADHVYAQFVHGKGITQANLLLLGRFTKDDEQSASLKFEAGFINGFAIPSNMLEQFIGLTLNYNLLAPGGGGFSAEQTNGALLLQPNGTQGD